MSTLTVSQATADARAAGFSGVGLTTIVAIAMAESGLQTDIRGKSDSRDRGIMQINSFWHSEVSDACAFDPVCAFQQAYRISGGGTNFGQWTTFTTGQYKQYTLQAGQNTGGTSADPCLGCGAKGSPAYLDCLAKSYASQGTSALPPCATGGTTVVQDAASSITSNVFAPLMAALPGWGIKIGLFLGALVLVIVGFWIIAGGEPVGDTQKLIKGAIS